MPQHPTNSQLNELIYRLYQGPLEANVWQGFLDLLREAFDAALTSLTVISAHGNGENRLLSRASIPPHWPRFDMRRWLAFDPFMQVETDRVVCLADLMAPEQLLESTYYQQVLAPASIHHILAVDIASGGVQDLKLRLRIARGPMQAAFSADDYGVLGSLVCHVKQALRYFTEMSLGRIERNVLAEAMNRLLFGVFILDDAGRITAANQVARDILEREPGLEIADGAFRIRHRRLNQDFYAILEGIRRGEVSGSVPRVLSLAPVAAAPLSLMVRPISREDASKYPIQSLAVVFLSDPMGMQDISTDSLREMFGLTEAEARTAVLLANGFTIDEAADRLGVSKNTAKTHSRMVYEKTGVSRQVKLIQLISNSVARVSP